MDTQVSQVDVVMAIHVEKAPDGWRKFVMKIGDTVVYQADKTGNEMWHPFIAPSLEDFRTLRNGFWHEFPSGITNGVGVATILVAPDKIKLMRNPGG